jgi:electron transfer flavoprotein alpha subunit
MVGLRSADTVVIVNPDPDLAGFESADFALVGTWEEFVPRFIAAVAPHLQRAS